MSSKHVWVLREIDRHLDYYQCKECGFDLALREGEHIEYAEKLANVPSCDEQQVLCVHSE